MKRRDFLKIIGAMGAIATLPLGAITEVKEYPEIKYEIDYLPEKQCYLHAVHSDTKENKWMVFEYSEEKILEQDDFLNMVAKINEKL